MLDNYNGSSKLKKLRKFRTPDAGKIEKKIQEMPAKLKAAVKTVFEADIWKV